ncbi:glucose 1-dehydrogenase [bacterium]|nr:glucose 1-dehydrogenase [bacterium]
MVQQRKVALVTGAARGIGKACAMDLARAGHDIVLVDLLDPEMAETANLIRAAGVDALAFRADVADHARAAEIVAAALAQFGRIDVLVNNAGVSAPEGIFEMTEAGFDRAIAINLKSCFNYIQPAARHMVARGDGRIVSISSLNALTGGVTAAVSKFAYAAAKAGILGMTRALAKELGPRVLVNAICPGVIRTEIDTNITEQAERFAAGIALGRLGTADDVARLVTFLATSEPCFITGQALSVDGFQFNI